MPQAQTTRRLAEFAAGLKLTDLPDAWRTRARMFVLDALGVMLAAVDFASREGDDQLTQYLRLIEAPGSGTLVGLGRRGAPAVAALFVVTLSELLGCRA